MARARVIGAVLSIILASSARRSFAREESTPSSSVAVRISENFHEGCPRTPSTRARIEGQLGKLREARLGEPVIELSFRVERADGVSHGALAITSPGGTEERNVASASCEDVVEALSVMAAVAIGEESRRVPRVEAPGGRRASPRTSAPRALGIQSSPRPVSRFVYSLGTGAALEKNPAGTLSATWFMQIGLPLPFEPIVRLGVIRSIRERIASSTGTVSVQRSEVTLATCAGIAPTQSLRIGPCLKLDLGRLDADVIVPLPVHQASDLWLAVGPAARLVWDVRPPFSLEASAGVSATLVRTELFFQDPHTVIYRAPVLIPFVGAALVTRLP